jgi:hypothetical protein
MSALFLAGTLLELEDGRTVVLSVAAAILAATFEFIGLGSPVLDPYYADEASL